MSNSINNLLSGINTFASKAINGIPIAFKLGNINTIDVLNTDLEQSTDIQPGNLLICGFDDTDAYGKQGMLLQLVAETKSGGKRINTVPMMPPSGNGYLSCMSFSEGDHITPFYTMPVYRYEQDNEGFLHFIQSNKVTTTFGEGVSVGAIQDIADATLPFASEGSPGIVSAQKTQSFSGTKTFRGYLDGLNLNAWEKSGITIYENSFPDAGYEFAEEDLFPQITFKNNSIWQNISLNNNNQFVIKNSDNMSFTLPKQINGNKLYYFNSDNGELVEGTTTKIVDGKPEIIELGHYINNTKIAINSINEPAENLYVNGNFSMENKSDNNTARVITFPPRYSPCKKDGTNPEKSTCIIFDFGSLSQYGARRICIEITGHSYDSRQLHSVYEFYAGSTANYQVSGECFGCDTGNLVIYREQGNLKAYLAFSGANMIIQPKLYIYSSTICTATVSYQQAFPIITDVYQKTIVPYTNNERTCPNRVIYRNVTKDADVVTANKITYSNHYIDYNKLYINQNSVPKYLNADGKTYTTETAAFYVNGLSKFKGNIVPEAVQTRDIGSSALNWRSAYVNTYYIYNNKVSCGKLYASTGDSTTSAPKYTYLELGNSSGAATTTARAGLIRLYSTNSYYSDIKARSSLTQQGSTFFLPAGDSNNDECYAVWSPESATAIGSTTLPVYVDAKGKVVACTEMSTLSGTGTQIPASANLQTATYLKVGSYYQGTSKTVQDTFKNCPVNVAFKMEVIAPISPTINDEKTGTYIYRIRKIIPFNTGIEYVQCVSTNGTAEDYTWGPWTISPQSTISVTGGAGATLTNGESIVPLYIGTDGRLTACSGVVVTTESQEFSGNKTFTGTLDVTGTTTLSNNLIVKGNTTLGDASSDTITTNGYFASNLIPEESSTYDLGSSTNTWGSANIDSIYTSYIDLYGELWHDGGSISFNDSNGDDTTFSVNMSYIDLGNSNENGHINIYNPTRIDGSLQVQQEIILKSDVTYGTKKPEEIYTSANPATKGQIYFKIIS